MGIYTNSVNGFVDESGQEIDIDIDALCEAFFYDDHYADSDAEKKELLESAEIALLEKKNITNRKTLVRLNKNDDISRRTTMAALQIAKQKNDSLFNKLVKNRIMERKLLTAIKKKYGSVAQRAAIKGQREYIKGTNSSKMLKASDLNNRSKD